MTGRVAGSGRWIDSETVAVRTRPLARFGNDRPFGPGQAFSYWTSALTIANFGVAIRVGLREKSGHGNGV